MKKKKIMLCTLILTVFFIVTSGLAMSQARSIFIGDLIELRVTSKSITIDELRDKFKDFEIVDVKEEESSFLITLRSFEPGEKTVLIGDKEIKIDIKSTLNEIKRDDIFEGDLTPKTVGASINWKYALYILTGLFLLSGVIYLWMYLKRKKVTSYTPYQLFINQSKEIPMDDDAYLVKLTGSFKKYIEASYSCLIRGKTSAELMNEIGAMPKLQPILPDVQQWFAQSDIFKFAGIPALAEDRRQLLAKLIELVKKIEDTKEGEA